MVAQRALMRLLIQSQLLQFPNLCNDWTSDLHSFGGFPDLLVDGCRVRVESTLAGELLADVEDKGQNETLSNRLVLEQSRVSGADGLVLIFDGLADGQELFFNLLIGVSDSPQGSTRGFNVVVLLDVPSRRLGLEWQHDDDEDGNHDLKDDNHAPVPLTERLAVLSAGIVDPIGDKGTHRVEHLPKGHNRASDV